MVSFSTTIARFEPGGDSLRTGEVTEERRRIDFFLNFKDCRFEID